MSGNCRVFLGRVSNRASEKDVERFFRDFKVREVVLKQGFGFVEFDNSREADDAVYEMNGKDLCGERVVVEMSNARRGGGGDRGGFRGGRGGFRGRGDFGGRGDYGGRGGFNGQRRFAAPVQTRYRLLVENLSTRCAWQELKDMMRGATYADAHKKAPNEGIVCFSTHSDLKDALKKHQGKDINGRKIKLIDDTPESRSRSRSRSKSRSRSPRSRSKSGGGSSHHDSRSRSRSPPPKRARSGSESE